MIILDVYDFDNTIYDGESVIDFFMFCLKKKKSLAKHLPTIFYTTVLYKMRLLSIDKLLKNASKLTSAFINSKDDFNKLAEEFWIVNKRKLKPKYLSKLKETDVIITASPKFLIDKILPELKVADAICSEFNTKTGQFEFANFGENKVVAFKKKYPNEHINNFYTDSLSDSPLIKISENSFIIKKNKEVLVK